MRSQILRTGDDRLEIPQQELITEDEDESNQEDDDEDLDDDNEEISNGDSSGE